MSQRIFGVGAASSGFLTPSSGNRGFFGNNVLQLWLNRQRIKNHEPRFLFTRVPIEANVPDGYGEVAYYRNVQQGQRSIGGSSNWNNVASQGFSAVNTSTTEPSMRFLQKGTVKFSPQLYITRYSYGRKMAQLSVLNFTMDVVEELMASYMAQKDLLVQDFYYADATSNNTANLIYPTDAITALSGITTSNRASLYMTLDRIRAARSRLDANYVPVFPQTGTYMMFITPEQQYDLEGSANNNSSFIEVTKHTEMLASRLMEGVIGKIFNVTVAISNNIRRRNNGASGGNLVNVHPAYIFGAGSAVMWKPQFELNFVTTPDRGSENNLDIRVGATFFWNMRILQPTAYNVILTTTSLH